MMAHHDASPDLPVCVRCHRRVRVNADRYDVFERMHWVCFHYEFEHEVGAPDRDPRPGLRRSWLPGAGLRP